MAKLIDRGSTFNVHPSLPENIRAEEVRSLSPLAVDQIRNLSLLSLGLGFFFSILALVNLLVLPGSISLESAVLAVASAAILMVIQFTCSRGVFPAAWVKPGGGAILMLALANAFLPLYATLEPRFTIGLVLLFTGAGFWMASDLGFIALLAGGILGWGVGLGLAPAPEDWLYFGFALLSSALLSGVIRSLRLRSAQQLKMLKEQEARYKGEIALASTYAGQAAVALENIRLYDEIKRLNLDLEDRVRQRTEALQAAYDQLEKLDRSKSDFISIASHELRTPLTVLQGYTQMLMDEAGMRDDPLHKQLVAGIYSGAVRLHEIVNQLLDAARIDSQALQIHPSPILIANLIDYVSNSLEKSIRERNLTLTIRNLEELPYVYADLEGLRKVFNQLIVNAIKYTPDGGQISITGRCLGGEQEQPEARAVEVVIADTGIGIDPDVQELIFSKFYQTGTVALHSSGKTKYKGGGPGLGLAIAKGVIEAHGGRIWVESPGFDENACPGSQFHVVLPLRSSSFG